MLEHLKEQVCRANHALVTEGLIILTWGNVSAIDRKRGLVVIKPSGVDYDNLIPELMSVVSLETGKTVEGELKPSSDTPTHLELYRAFGQIGGIVHTHSLHATSWAQADRGIPALGTTHADYFNGIIPCTRPLSDEEIKGDYEINTGRVIVELFKTLKLNPMFRPAALVAGHGPFAWGATADKAVENAVVLEYLASMAFETLNLAPGAKPVQQALLDKHFFRKHGPGAYYGQSKSD